VALRYGPAAVPLGGRVLASRWPALAQELGGRDLTPWGTAVGANCREPRRHMYISRKFWFDHLFFENHDKLNIKKIRRGSKEGGIAVQLLFFFEQEVFFFCS
jgi:hypothetical protein